MLGWSGNEYLNLSMHVTCSLVPLLSHSPTYPPTHPNSPNQTHPLIHSLSPYHSVTHTCMHAPVSWYNILTLILSISFIYFLRMLSSSTRRLFSSAAANSCIISSLLRTSSRRWADLNSSSSCSYSTWHKEKHDYYPLTINMAKCTTFCKHANCWPKSTKK